LWLRPETGYKSNQVDKGSRLFIAWGAAIAALIASERDFDYAEWTRPDGYVEPREEMAEHYEEGFAYYLDSVEAVRGLWGGRPRAKTPQ
jgi:hypothetical protein